MENGKKEPTVQIIGFREEIANIQTAIADFESGHNNLNVAIISEPYAGRTALMNEIEKMNPQKVTKYSFSSIVKNKDEIILSEHSKRIVLIDDCQFLYMRKIGGFDVLKEFLNLISNPAILFITTWNLYSWKYLDEVSKIGKFFPVQINLPKFTTSQLKESILSGYEKEEIKFVEDVEFEKEKIINLMKYPISIKPWNKAINLPYFKINYNILKLRLLKKEERVAIEDMIFEKIHHVSNGNPGVAKIVWQRSLEYPIIKPSKIKDESFNIELDYDESFVLNIILSTKSIKNNDLSQIVGLDFQVEKIIFQLSKLGLIKAEDGSCIIRPEALKSVVEFLKKSRLVW
ncbi:MAG: hypothetical protein O8C59_04800 [Candidatus Methanoperedens sp.]|nr:hypothetical protein [Candidatus Methanoperedens sp.]